jgi:hypothetical protein
MQLSPQEAFLSALPDALKVIFDFTAEVLKWMILNK